MIENEITHHIQKYILDVLLHHKTARFKDLRKPGVDTNLFSYHLKLLTKQGFVKKQEYGYTLDRKGLIYVDRLSSANGAIRLQPKIVCMLVVQNEDGGLLLWKRNKQPYIDAWTLPHGKLHLEDETIIAAARREAFEKMQIEDAVVEHAGDCYVRVDSGGERISTTLMHIFRMRFEEKGEGDDFIWVRPHALHTYQLAPAVEQIVARTFFNDPYFFEEFLIRLPDATG